MLDCAGVCDNNSTNDALFDCLGNCEGDASGDDCVVAGISDGCDLVIPDSYQTSIFLMSDGSVVYNTTVAIAGFQFGVDGTTISGGSGGAAEDAGFTISAGGSTVLGFDFSGAVVPVGCGTLTILTFDGTPTGLTEDKTGNFVAFSDSNAGYIAVYVDNVSIESTSGECTSGYYDCNGTCDGTSVEDCNGNCDGFAVFDCVGDCGGLAELDACGVCNGPGYFLCNAGVFVCDESECPQDCAGVPNGNAELDECGVSDGSGYVVCDDGSMVCDESDCEFDGGGWDGNACTMPMNTQHLQ
jgi:hypothetical protein